MVPVMVLSTMAAVVPLTAMSLRESKRRAMAEARAAYALAVGPDRRGDDAQRRLHRGLALEPTVRERPEAVAA